MSRSDIKIQKVRVSSEDVASSSTNFNIVDPWVPRIRHNDEYLQQGMDFSIVVLDSPSTDSTGSDKQNQHENNDDGNNNNCTKKSSNAKIMMMKSPMGNIGAIRLADALSFNTRLMHLNLAGNEIGVEGAVAIAKALYSSSSSSSSSTSSSGNNGTTKREKVKSKKTSNTALKSLNLSNNHISEEGVKAFAYALRYNTSLLELDLSRNGINATGITGLLEHGMMNNQCLKRLYLSDNLSETQMKMGGNNTGDDNNNIRREVKRILKSLAKVLINGCKQNGGCALELLELHNNGAVVSSEVDSESACLLTHAMYVVRENNGNESLKESSREHKNDNNNNKYGLTKSTKLQNHRFRRLTLPQYYDLRDDDASIAKNNNGNQKKNQSKLLQQILSFNTFYHPIMELHDIWSEMSSLSHQEQALFELPYHLQMDGSSGALIALLPPIDTESPSSSSKSPCSGLELKLMPRLLSFTSNECKLDTVWNVIRYRPDTLRYAAKRVRHDNKIVDAVCGGGGRGGRNGCIIM